jgi:hypothetical protein
MYPGVDSQEAGAVKLAALDVLVELVADEGVMDSELEGKCVSLACDSLAAARTEEALDKCKAMLLKMSRALAGASSRMLTYAHVCSRMLTYDHAHVCSRMADVCGRMQRVEASETL